jgi:exopolyphosphatase/guanosine-5'-triphosphate,3'-diphosphate pyrophosphatase
MSAVFEEFGLKEMHFSEGALRLGVLYDLLGRQHHHDPREATVRQFMRRYQVDARQAARVAQTALMLMVQMRPQASDPEDPCARSLFWAAQLHEIGISVAHASYHKHSAYILGNADMPGFSRMDQGRLARLVLSHRGRLERVLALMPEADEWAPMLCLRLAALLHRARDDQPLPLLKVAQHREGFSLRVDQQWLEDAPLAAAALEEEKQQWANVGWPLRLTRVRSSRPGLIDGVG